MKKSVALRRVVKADFWNEDLDKGYWPCELIMLRGWTRTLCGRWLRGRRPGAIDDMEFLETLAQRRCMVMPPWVFHIGPEGEAGEVDAGAVHAGLQFGQAVDFAGGDGEADAGALSSGHGFSGQWSATAGGTGRAEGFGWCRASLRWRGGGGVW